MFYTFSRFDTLLACDRQTDGHYARHSKNRHHHSCYYISIRMHIGSCSLVRNTLFTDNACFILGRGPYSTRVLTSCSILWYV